MLCIYPMPLRKRKSILHPNQTSPKTDVVNQGVTTRVAAMCVKKHSFVHKQLDPKPGDISFLYFAFQFLCSAIFEQQKNHPKEPLGILSHGVNLLAVYIGVWNGE